MGNFDANRRQKTTQAEVLRGFANRLMALEGFGTQNVVVSDTPIPSTFPGGKRCLVVCGTDGEFSGPSSSQLIENSGVIVGIYSASFADRAGRAEAKLLNDDSLYDLKFKVIKQLALAEPDKKWQSRDWEPTRSVGELEVPILREPPRLVSSRGPIDVPLERERSKWVGIQLFFSAVFDWVVYD